MTGTRSSSTLMPDQGAVARSGGATGLLGILSGGSLAGIGGGGKIAMGCGFGAAQPARRYGKTRAMVSWLWCTGKNGESLNGEKKAPRVDCGIGFEAQKISFPSVTLHNRSG